LEATPTSFTALLASNLLAQFSRQIVIQILGLESPTVCGGISLDGEMLEYFTLSGENKEIVSEIPHLVKLTISI
jgi:hypothetical protein